jgi:uncharacterized protein YneF (UPF0154 family)
MKIALLCVVCMILIEFVTAHPFAPKAVWLFYLGISLGFIFGHLVGTRESVFWKIQKELKEMKKNPHVSDEEIVIEAVKVLRVLTEKAPKV